MTDEIWKSVKGYEGLYEVSNKGRVRSLDRTKVRRQGSVICEVPQKGRVLRQMSVGTKRNYLKVTLTQRKTVDEPRKQKAFYVHRLVAEAYIPNPEGKTDVNHIDGNPHNNNVANLEWNTRKENVNHALKIGLSKMYGSNHPLSKLTEEDVREIRKMYSKGEKGKGYIAIAKIYGVSQKTIEKIVKGKTWKRI